MFLFFLNKKFTKRGIFFTPRSHMRHAFWWIRLLYFKCFGLSNRKPADCNDRAQKSQDNFEYYSDWIHLNEESHIRLGCLEGEWNIGLGDMGKK